MQKQQILISFLFYLLSAKILTLTNSFQIQCNKRRYSHHKLHATERKKYDYLLAIPLEENHDFLLELESIQRGILYHCPKLADACIMPVNTRMPLLLIAKNDKEQDDMNTFEGILKHVIQQELNDYTKNTQSKELEEGITEERRKGGVNDEGIQPLMMSFQGLELEDGISQQNEILYAIGNDDDGNVQQVIRNFIDKIRLKLDGMGYETRLPDDQPHGKDLDGLWRPRVPFMRLPADFTSTLEKCDNDDDDDDDDMNLFGNIKTPEEGYNGISPLFWYKWSNDKFTDTIGIRLRTLSIYRRQSNLQDIFSSSFIQKYLDKPNNEHEPLWTEKMFYVPVLNIPLPIGNALLTEYEGMLANSARERLDDASKHLDEKMQYDIPQSITGTIDKINTSTTTTNTNVNKPSTTTTSKTIDNNDNKQTNEIPKLKSLERYRQKLQQQQLKPANDAKDQITKPYPSIEHFVGIWKLVLPNSKSDQSNEADNNIILRIDGTIAGGPILSTITTTSNKDKDDTSLNTFEQKAASGSQWRYYQAQYIDDSNVTSTRMRIQLVIPPQKTHEVVLEGEVVKLVMPKNNFLSMQNEEYYLQLQGEVWMQDVAGVEKKKMGRFSAVKMATPSKKQLRYSIPPPKR